LLAEHHLRAEHEDGPADHGRDAWRHRHAVRQAEQDQHEAERPVAERIHDVADLDGVAFGARHHGLEHLRHARMLGRGRPS
jgi:hypothetical protein